MPDDFSSEEGQLDVGSVPLPWLAVRSQDLTFTVLLIPSGLYPPLFLEPFFPVYLLTQTRPRGYKLKLHPWSNNRPDCPDQFEFNP